ncbi:MAG: TerB family tellurite resistance protein [Alphaproteobacteria bacterium]|nr:TerB family tellurite resistance protein [Alphaproteobacteria bacterium]
MSIWGKIGGAAAGFLLGGGPLSALLGMLAGHALFDRETREGAPEDSVAFTVGLVALTAKMARADGLVTEDEFAAFQKVVIVPPEEAANVRRLFDIARQDVAGFEAYARQLATLFKDTPGRLEDILDGLFFVAAADARLHPAEMDYLRAVADIFGISDSAFNRLCRAYGGPCDPDPYAILNIDPDASDADVRAAYLYQVKENHPDNLTARGAPAEFIKVATEKLHMINDAYRQITSEREAGRGLKAG